jgi:hypothetical protein
MSADFQSALVSDRRHSAGIAAKARGIPMPSKAGALLWPEL